MNAIPTETVGRAVTAAQPYPWPYHGRLDASRCALVACLDPSWRTPSPQSDDSDLRLRAAARALHEAGGRVVALTAMPMRRGGDRSVHLGRPVAMSAADLPAADLPADEELASRGTSGFYGSGLDALLRAGGFQDLLVAGWGLEGPVHSTLRAANDRGYECLLLPDASTSLAPGLARPACEMVRFSGGIFGAFADTADVIAALRL